MPTALVALLHLPEGFCVLSLIPDDHQILVAIASTATSAPCPHCGVISARLHSNYVRRLIDVPCGGRTIVLQVHSHKWRCQIASCPQRVFAERLTPFAQVQARMTERCVAAVQHLGLFVNGEGGVRLGQRIGIATTPTTLLRRVMALPDPDFPDPIRVGVDDWSYRRRKRFGTILVDHDLRRVIDLLPDTEVPPVAGWFRQRPSVRRISRDRSTGFAAAIAEGAPQATQVLDRWHLLKNLTDLLPAILAPCVRRLRQTHSPTAPGERDYPDPAHWKPATDRMWEQQRLAQQQERNVR